MSHFATETDLAAVVVADFIKQGFEVYESLVIPGWPEVPDIVAICRGELVIAETKLGVSFDAVAQAAQWLPYCTRAWLIVPRPEGWDGCSRGWALAERVMRSEEIGCAMVRGQAVSAVVPPRRRALPYLRDIGILAALDTHDPTKARPAGSPGNPRESKWSHLDEPLRLLLAGHPKGLRVAEALRRLSAVRRFGSQGFTERIAAGRVQRVVLERGRVKLADSQERAA